MIIVFGSKYTPVAPYSAAFPVYEPGIGYEVGASISQIEADKCVADGKASVIGTYEQKKVGAKPGSKEVMI